MKGHKLIIISLHDTQLTCSCGKWWFVRPGEMTRKETREPFQDHLKVLRARREEGARQDRLWRQAKIQYDNP